MMGVLMRFGNAGSIAVAVALVVSCHDDIKIGDLPDESHLDVPADIPPALATSLPTLTGVNVIARDDSVGIDFEPVDDAVDYRVYALPSAADVTANSDGSITVKNGIYRCAGLRQALDLPNNVGNDANASAGQAYWNPPYNWSAEVSATPTLGYVYRTPAPDRVPVYAVGVHPTDNELGWRESRSKIYTTDASARQALLAARGRDDGIVFYVPAASSDATQTVYHSAVAIGADTAEYYFGEADKDARAGDTTPPVAAFQVMRAATDGSVPLDAVRYGLPTQYTHTELAVGKERFKRAVSQGNGPLWHLEWSGLTQKTTLVVEALKTGCPFQGLLSAQHLSAPPHQTLLTLDDLQKASSTGEVFINGQYDLPGTAPGGLAFLQTPNASPIPIARSFIQVEPKPHDPNAWDWYQGFPIDTTLPSASPTPDPGFAADSSSWHWSSSLFDIGAYSIDHPNGVQLFTHGLVLGQLVTIFDDWEHDVTGRIRFTAVERATIATDPSSFLHITWSVNTVATDRRYPQMLVSDQAPPVEDGLLGPDRSYLVVQTNGGPSMGLEVQAFRGLVNNSPWTSNNQAPRHVIIDHGDVFAGGSDPAANGPADPPFEHAGMDRMTKFDAYISSGVLYIFMDDAPAGCTQYPSGFALSGSVTVTFGDVLDHEGAEVVCQQARPYAFLHGHQCTETRRQWDDLGFKSGVAAPPWDSARFPCRSY